MMLNQLCLWLCIVIQMGCSCSGINRQMQLYFKDDEELGWKTDLFSPRPSTLYALLRKPKELVVVHSEGQPLLANSLLVDSAAMSPGDLRNLIGQRRRVLFLCDCEAEGEMIKAVKSVCSCSRYYAISKAQAQSFLAKYPIFQAKQWQQGRLQTAQLPILAVDTSDLKEEHQFQMKLFVHGTQKADRRVYQQIGVDWEEGVVGEPQEGDLKKYYVREIRTRIAEIKAGKPQLKSILVLHGPQVQPALLVEILAEVLKQQYGVPEQSALAYLRRSLPLRVGQEQEEQRQVVEEKGESSQECFARLFKEYEGEANLEKVERLYNLVNTLTTNIYSNEGETYRRVKRTTRQMRELVEGYESGRKILQQMGWRQGEEQWENRLEGKYLKVFRTDFDLGFKLYRASK